MKKYLTALTFALTLISALFATGLSQAQTQTTTAPTATTHAAKAHAKPKKGAKNKAHAKTKAKKVAKSKVHAKTKKATGKNAQAVTQWNQKYKAQEQAKANAIATPAKMPFSSTADDDDREPELSGTKSADFSCEMGNRLTIYKNDQDDKHIAIRWNQHISRLTRVSTTTGANRFENHKIGLVWIGIPAKGILLDSKKGQQLANDCKNAAQTNAAATAAPAASNS